MRKSYWFVLLPVLAVAWHCEQAGQPIQIIGGGAQCTIVLDVDPFESVREAEQAFADINWFGADDARADACTKALAALELRHYLAGMTGLPEKALPIVDDQDSVSAQRRIIFVGAAPANKRYYSLKKQIQKRWKRVKSKDPQGFRLDTFSNEQGEALVLSGKSRVGVLYAAYEMLDRLGVRWFSPGEHDEFIPEMQQVVIPGWAQYVEPVMKIRGFWIEPSISMEEMKNGEPADRGNTAFFKWMGRNRLNMFWHNESGYALLKQRGVLLNTGGHDPDQFLVSPSAPDPYNPGKPPEDAGDLLSANSSGNAGQQRPEPNQAVRFASFEEKVSSAKRQRPVFCASDEQTLADLSRQVVNMLRDGDWKHVDIVDVWPVDGSGWCRCSDCQKLGNDTDKLLHVIGRLRDAIDQARANGILQREVRIFGFGYKDTMQPPTVRLDKHFGYNGTAMVLFPATRCYEHSLWDQACSEVNKNVSLGIDRWLSKKNPYKGAIYIGEYYNASRFRDLPVVLTTVIGKDIPDYQQKGIRGIYYMHPRTMNLGVQALLDYQFARLSWNPSADIQVINNEFFAHHYTGVSSQMREYYGNLEKAMANIMAWRYELVNRIREKQNGRLDGPLVPLKIFARHFSLEESGDDPNKGTDWANTYQAVQEARYILEEAMAKEVSDGVFNRLLDDEYQLRYAELTVRLYDNIIRFLTLGDDEPEMRAEAGLRLRDTAGRLAQFQIRTPALGVANGLAASELQPIVERLTNETGVGTSQSPWNNHE